MTVADIILAVDEPIDATSCGGEENCHDDKRCMTHDLWAGLNKHIHTYLAQISLAQLVHAGRDDAPVVLHDRRLRGAKRPSRHERLRTTEDRTGFDWQP